MNKRSKRKRTRGAISVVALLLFTSALLRVSANASENLAETKVPLVETERPEIEQMESDAPTDELLLALLMREKRVKDKETELLKREKIVSVAKFEIERRIIAMEQAELALSSTLAQADAAAEDDVSQLIKVYESMKPKDAAALFEAMEPAFAAGFLGRMRPETAAGVLTGLSPKAAYTISVILAGRNANAPKK